MSDDLKVTVLSPYPFHMVEQGRQLYESGVLERMVTAVPSSRTGLPRELVASRMRWSALRRTARRVIPSADPWLNRQVILDFDRWAATSLGTPSLVNGLSGFATGTLSAASARGMTVCCDRGSWHILEQQRVLDEEADRIGAPRVRFDPFIMDRELREYELADRILVPSERARESFIRRGQSAHKVVKVPYGVDVSAFTSPAGGRVPGRLISVATVGLQKGHYHLLRAFRMLNVQNASLTLVGSITPGWEKQLRLDQAGVRATGPVSRAHVISELQQASIFVLASLQEGLALVLAQAMACGLPVVATEATGIRELVDDGVEGIVVPDPPRAETLAAALDSLLSDRERLRAMGAAARKKVESLGGWECYGQRLISAFRDAGPARL